jgi:hypothetical protein
VPGPAWSSSKSRPSTSSDPSSWPSSFPHPTPRQPGAGGVPTCSHYWSGTTSDQLALLPNPKALHVVSTNCKNVGKTVGKRPLGLL